VHFCRLLLDFLAQESRFLRRLPAAAMLRCDLVAAIHLAVRFIPLPLLNVRRMPRLVTLLLSSSAYSASHVVGCGSVEETSRGVALRKHVHYHLRGSGPGRLFSWLDFFTIATPCLQILSAIHLRVQEEEALGGEGSRTALRRHTRGSACVEASGGR